MGWQRRGDLVQAIGLLPVVSLHLRRHGYRATSAWLDERCGPGRRPADPEPVDVSRARELGMVVRLAGRAIPDATCLRRALVLRHLLGGPGSGASVRLGAKADPATGALAFHAWVTLNGAVVSEPASAVNGFVELGEGQSSPGAPR
ncbi:MAG: lasso peptide biosynthesis B2 protein [Acidimicrobiales bacterium]